MKKPARAKGTKRNSSTKRTAKALSPVSALDARDIKRLAKASKRGAALIERTPDLKPSTAERMSPCEAAEAIARRWLGKFFSEGREPEEFFINSSGESDEGGVYLVELTFHVPRFDVDLVVGGTHPDQASIEYVRDGLP